MKRTQAEYEALKQQKKEEAAQRKRLHAEGVARRKQTNIVFLGRGVSRGLADRRANIEKLQQYMLPVLAAPADLAAALGISIPQLRWLAYHNEAATRTHYVRFSVPKKSGGTRELAAPHKTLRHCQEWIFDNILDKLPVHGAAHGFTRGRSTVTNAAGHAGRDVLVNTDLKDFFPSITFPRVAGMFRGLGYSPAVAAILALLCTESPRKTVEYVGVTYHVATGPRALPQGACTSPALSNRAARKLDMRLAGLAAKLGWNYTRYADDATFSASGEAAGKVGYLLAQIRHISQDEGFAVNETKTRVLRQNSSQRVTGIVVNQHPAAPRKLVRRLRAILHHAKSEGLAAQNRGRHENFVSWLGGMIAYVAMVNPDQARPLQVQFAALRERESRGAYEHHVPSAALTASAACLPLGPASRRTLPWSPKAARRRHAPSDVAAEELFRGCQVSVQLQPAQESPTPKPTKRVCVPGRKRPAARRSCINKGRVEETVLPYSCKAKGIFSSARFSRTRR